MRSLSHDNRRTSLYITPEFEELLHASFSTAFSKSVACLKSYMIIQNHKHYVREVLKFHSPHYTCMWYSWQHTECVLHFQYLYNAQLSRDEQISSATLFHLQNNKIDYCSLSCLLIMRVFFLSRCVTELKDNNKFIYFKHKNILLWLTLLCLRLINILMSFNDYELVCKILECSNIKF